MTRTPTFLVLLFLLVSCSSKKNIPFGILKPEKMQEVFWDIIRAETYTSQYFARDTSKNVLVENVRLQKQVFAVHKISKEDFYNSFKFYESNPTLMYTLLDSMVKNADREKIVIKTLIPEI